MLASTRFSPLAVVLPRSVDDVAATIAWAWRSRLADHSARRRHEPLGPIDRRRESIIDFSRYLNRILEIDPERQTARIEPGVVLDELNAAAAKHGLQFAPDVATSSRANIGGMIGNNSAGSRIDLARQDGRSRDRAHRHAGRRHRATRSARSRRAKCAAAAERSDRWGHVYREVRADRRPRARRNHRPLSARAAPRERIQPRRVRARVPRSACPSRAWWPKCAAARPSAIPARSSIWPNCIVGAEGTLATVTEALVHLVPLPAARGVVVLHFSSLDVVGGGDQSGARVRSVGGRTVRRPDPAAGRKEPRISQLSRFRRRPARVAAVGRIQRRQLRRGARPRPTASRSACKASRAWSTVCSAHRAGDLRPRLGLPQGGAAAAAKRRLGAQADGVCRRHGGRSAAAQPSSSHGFARSWPRHGTDGAFYGHASVGCLHIRPHARPVASRPTWPASSTSRTKCANW